MATDVLLGAGGAIATALAPVLLAKGRHVRLVSRRAHAMPGSEAVAADLLDAAAVRNAVVEDSTVFLLAGLPYHASTWEDQWPRIMRNAIDACAERAARLIFFDNVYMYGSVDSPMTEETPVKPTSRKGAVRARIVGDLLAAAAAGRVKASIARAADFYGPHATNSIPRVLVFTRLAAGKRARWPADASVPHSFTYVCDCGPALATLAEADDAWGQVWHLPTARPALSGGEFVALAAHAMGGPSDVTVLPSWMMRLAGIFDTTVRESIEMLYQYDRPYLFDSTKFERRFGVHATPEEVGIAETARVVPAAAPSRAAAR